MPKKNGIDLSALRARQFTVDDFDVFDMIYVMDKNNMKNVLALAKNDLHKKKVRLFLTANDATLTEVPDPYYGTEDDFEAVFKLVFKNCKRLAGIL